MNKKIYYIISWLSLLPFISFADPVSGVSSLLKQVLNLLGTTGISLMFTIALLYFFWGLIQFIRSAGDSKVRDDGKQKMLWGVIALFVMVSIYGIINFIIGAFSLTNTAPTLPKITQ